jgi:hypothetical protein
MPELEIKDLHVSIDGTPIIKGFEPDNSAR